MTYAPSKEQFKLDLFRYKTDEIYCIKDNFIVMVPIEYNRYHLDRWHDDAMQMVIGLWAKGTAIKSIPNELKKIIGQSPKDDTIRRWIKLYQQKYGEKRAPF